MRSPKAPHWWAWKKKKEEKENGMQNNENSNKILVQKLQNNFPVNRQVGGTEPRVSFLNRVKYLPTIPMDDYSKVRTRLDDIYILPNGDIPMVESMQRKE